MLDVWVAGRKGNRPLLWNVETGRHALPEVELAPDGEVLIGHPLWHADDPAVAVETRDGSALLFPTASGWERLDLPAGRLVDIGVYGPPNAGGSAEGARVIAVVDGAIWMRDPD
ncbi:MAG TPA: hypothetical protein VF377_02150 [Acidimicrobiia bacterium]